jgi:predicted glutamine amidotransferase
MNAKRYRLITMIVLCVSILLVLAVAGCGRYSSESSGAPSLASTDHNCRFWCIISTLAPASVIQAQLVTDPNSLKILGAANPNGWSVGYFSGGSPQPVVNRGKDPASNDALFDAAVAEAANAKPCIVVSHVRKSTTGLLDIPNPHPFEGVTNNGKYWLMGHNGTIDKNVLLSLIRPEYLASHPPVNGTNLSEWNDSELYFIFMMQAIEDNNYNVKAAIGHVVQSLCDKISGTGEQLNFFLTDGTTLWGYRQGRSLYYFYSRVGTTYSVLASQYTSASQGSWVTMSDGQMVTMSQTGAPLVEAVKKYFSQPSITVVSPNGGESWVRGTKHAVTWSGTSLTGYVKIQLYKAGSAVRTISSAAAAAGGSFTWSIPSSQSLGSDYRIRITSTSSTAVSDTSDANFTIAAR